MITSKINIEGTSYGGIQSLIPVEDSPKTTDWGSDGYVTTRVNNTYENSSLLDGIVNEDGELLDPLTGEPVETEKETKTNWAGGLALGGLAVYMLAKQFNII